MCLFMVMVLAVIYIYIYIYIFVLLWLTILGIVGKCTEGFAHLTFVLIHYGPKG